MAKQPRYQSDLAYQGASGDGLLAVAQGQQNLAARLGQYAEIKNAQADRQAVSEGKQAGLQAAAGKVKGVEYKPGGTLRDDAFNQGALAAHGAAIQNDIRTTTAKLMQEHPDNPEAFEEAFEGYREGLLAEMPEQARPLVIGELEDFGGRARIQIQGEFKKREQSAQWGEIETALTGTLEEAGRAGRDGELDNLEKKRAQYMELLDQAAEARLIDPDKADKLRLAFEEQADSEIVLGGFERLLYDEAVPKAQALANAEAAIERFEREPPEELSTAQRDTLGNRMHALASRLRTELAREEAAAKAATAARDKWLTEQLRDAEAAISRGYEPPNLEELVKLSAGTEHAKQAGILARDAGAMAQFIHLPPTEQEARINALKGNRARSGDQAKLIERLEKAHSETLAGLKKDPLGLSIRQGINKPLPALDLSSTEALAEGLAARSEAARRAEAHYGQSIPPLQAGEASQLGDLLSRPDATPAQTLTLLATTVEGLGGRALEGLAMLDSQRYPQLATAGEALLRGEQQAAELIVKGLAQARENKAILPPDKDLNLAFDEALKGVADPLPALRNRLTLAAKAAYAELAAREGDFSGAYDSSRAKAAMEAVTGGIIEWDPNGWRAGSRVRAPVPGMSSKEFTRWMDEGLQPSDIAAMGGVGEFDDVAALSAIRSHGRLQEIERGKYLVYIAGAPLLKKGSAKPFVLEYRP